MAIDVRGKIRLPLYTCLSQSQIISSIATNDAGPYTGVVEPAPFTGRVHSFKLIDTREEARIYTSQVGQVSAQLTDDGEPTTPVWLAQASDELAKCHADV